MARAARLSKAGAVCGRWQVMGTLQDRLSMGAGLAGRRGGGCPFLSLCCAPAWCEILDCHTLMDLHVFVPHPHFTHSQTEAHPGYWALKGRVRISMPVCPSTNSFPPVTCLGVLSLLGEGLGMGPAGRCQRGGKNKGDCQWREASLLLKRSCGNGVAYCFSPVGGAMTYRILRSTMVTKSPQEGGKT